MSWLAWSLVIFLTALVTILGTAVLTSRQPRIPLDRLADPRPMPGELPRAGRLGIEGPFDLPAALILSRLGTPIRAGRDPEMSYGPFPVDTGPLLILSEQAAANVALEREIEQRCAEAEAKIPLRWR